MKAKEIQDLIDFIAKSGLNEVNIETEEFKIKVRKNAEVKIIEHAPTPTAPIANYQPPPTQNEIPAKTPTPPNEEADNKNYVIIKSPMIGTFYRSPNPDEESFVNVGDKIRVGETVCIIEAMKLFNEIESEVSGSIVKILCENSTPVEYGQDLFLVDPA